MDKNPINALCFYRHKKNMANIKHKLYGRDKYKYIENNNDGKKTTLSI